MISLHRCIYTVTIGIVFQNLIFPFKLTNIFSVVYVTRDSNDELPCTVSFTGFIEFIVESIDP